MLVPAPARLRWRWLLLVLPMASVEASLGGEKPLFDTPMMTANITHRQNVCDRYYKFRHGELELKDALEGLQLHVLMSNYDGGFFNFDEEKGIHPDYPGLQAVLLDELGRRGKFTWRESFGLSGDPSLVNVTWTDLLLWGVETYDVNIDWWAQNLERMNMGVAFLKPWYDSSIILITKEIPEVISDEVNWWNWLKPYEANVWYVTIFTVLVSGVVYQILEWFADDRQERSMWEWWQENAYLSAINFTQAYEYQPKSFASRIFGISMAIWALVMTATYTANLASLLVDRKAPPLLPQTVEEIAVFGMKICTWEGTNSDIYIRDTYPSAIRIPKTQQIEVYDGLHTGECDFMAEVVAAWDKAKGIREFNPTCDLLWVGGDRKIRDVSAGFATKADSGEYCTGLIRDVINLHMHDMILDGFLEDAWQREHKKSQDINCDTYRPELAAALAEDDDALTNTTDDDSSGSRRRYLLRQNCQRNSQRQQQVEQQRQLLQEQRHRLLKGAGRSGAAGGAVAAAAAAGGSEGEAERLTMKQMVGTFAFHWGIMIISLALACGNALYVKRGKRYVRKMGESVRQSQFFNSMTFGAGGNTRRTEETSSRDGDDAGCFDNDDESERQQRSDQPLPQEWRSEMSSLRESQLQMQLFQQEMLNEQRNLQRQIQALLANQQQPNQQQGMEQPNFVRASSSILRGTVQEIEVIKSW